MRRALLILAVLGAAASLAVALGVRPSTGPSEPDPVLFVHGWLANGTVWDAMIDRLAADGHDRRRLHAWSYDSSRPNEETARAVAAEVEAILASSGATRVDVVTHSMGGLSSRWYLKHLGGTAHVDAWVSLGGPNHGMDVRSCRQPVCDDMRTGSPFLAELNAGDETPGDVRYGTWWSSCDEAIDPVTSVELEGATNTRTACLSHGALVDDPAVYRQVRDFLR